MKEKVLDFLAEKGIPYLIFILAILKLTNILSVSWWVVFSPWLISVAIALFIVFVVEKMHQN